MTDEKPPNGSEGLAAYLKQIAESVSVLPDVLKRLDALDDIKSSVVEMRADIAHLNDEVRAIHTILETMSKDNLERYTELRRDVDRLRQDVDAMRGPPTPPASSRARRGSSGKRGP